MNLVKLYAPSGAGGTIQGVYTGQVAIGADGTVLVDPRDADALLQLGFSATTGVPGVANFRNLIDGGDFTVNPWQRGTSFSAIGATLTYTADRFFAVGGASSSIAVSQQPIAGVPGISQALQFGRSNGNANTAPINLGQVLETLDSIRAQGQLVTLSFWVLPGATFSGNGLNVQIITGTGNNQSAAAMVSGAWTGQTSVVNQNQPLGSGLQRYSFTGTVPANATELGVLFSYTPSGTAGATDVVLLAGVQLELGNAAGPFEHRDVQVELEICQRYFFNIPEPGANVVVGAGMVNGTNSELIFIPLPVQMRAAPSVTVTAGSFKFNLAGTPTAVAGFAAGTTHTPNYISIIGTTTATSGQATMLQGGGGSGTIQASADL